MCAINRNRPDSNPSPQSPASSPSSGASPSSREDRCQEDGENGALRQLVATLSKLLQGMMGASVGASDSDGDRDGSRGWSGQVAPQGSNFGAPTPQYVLNNVNFGQQNFLF